MTCRETHSGLSNISNQLNIQTCVARIKRRLSNIIRKVIGLWQVLDAICKGLEKKKRLGICNFLFINIAG